MSAHNKQVSSLDASKLTMEASSKIASEKQAFNLGLLRFSEVQIRALKPVSSLDIFESSTSTDFHEAGLFSTEIFGRVGDKKRDTTFSYVDIKTSVLHPLIHRTIRRLKAFYIDIIEGRTHAVWNPETKQFDKAGELDGQTGYAFFMKHWKEVGFTKTTSLVRNQRIDMIEKWRDVGIYDKVVVLPAGLRDAEMDENGRPREHEINPIYRKIMSISNTISSGRYGDDAVFDRARVSLQTNFNLLYETIERLVQGKNGFVEDKWTARRIINGTRNVVSSQDPSMEDLDDPDAPDSNSTIIGLWQLSKGALPITISQLKGGILEEIFGTVEGGARLVDPETLKSERVNVDANVYDRWTTNEGLEKVISLQKSIEVRHKPVMVDGRYLALIYRPKDEMVFKMFHDIDDLPSNRDKKDVYPISYMELIYLCNYRGWNRLGMTNTRYPVTGESSTMPSKAFVATTVVSDRRVELDDQWNYPEDPEEYVASAYPNFEGMAYVDAVKVSPFKIIGAGGDYDGDTFSNNVVMTEEAINEIDAYLQTREAHIDPGGGMRSSTHIDTTEFVMHNLTGEPDESL